MTPGIDNLHFITSGPLPPNPTELLGSRAFYTFLKEVRYNYDLLLFDSPSILSGTDAHIIGSKMDGILFVTMAEPSARGKRPKCTSTQLGQFKNILGIVLNGIKTKN
jgi:Mrp family chromosome partitioning ATPase